MGIIAKLDRWGNEYWQEEDESVPAIKVADRNEVVTAPNTTELTSSSSSFGKLIVELRSLPCSQVKASLGQEAIQRAKGYRDRVKAIFNPFVNALHKAHTEATALRKKFDDPGAALEEVGRGAVTEWEFERRRRLDEERRAKEKEARGLAEQQRKEELVALAQQGAPKEVIETRAEAPIVIATPVVDEDRGKVEGVSTVERWIGHVSDRAKWLHFIADNPGLHHLVEDRQTQINQWVTHSKGEIPDCGLTVQKDISIRSRQS